MKHYWNNNWEKNAKVQYIPKKLSYFQFFFNIRGSVLQNSTLKKSNEMQQ